MSFPLPEAEVRRIYLDALERAVRHAAVHVPRDEAVEIGHHVATAVARRCIGKATERPGAARTESIHEMDAFVHRAVLKPPARDLAGGQATNCRGAGVREGARRCRTRMDPAGAHLESRELHDAIEAAIDVLPEAQRTVFLLIRRDQRTYKEVAAQLGIAVGTVHTHLSRANAALREAVADFRNADHPGTIGRPRTVRLGT